MPEQPGSTEERDRFLLGCAVVQSGYVDQDDDAPDWFDILQWHPCFEEPNCRARDNSGPCACGGVPFISDEIWRHMAKVVAEIREDARQRGIAEGRSRATEHRCPRIAYESGIVLACTVDHGRLRSGLHANSHHKVLWDEDDDRVIAEPVHHRYMMATTAIHRLGDISRDRPDLAIIDREEGDDYVGQWAASFVGYIEVRFPKATTRPLNAEERERYSSMLKDGR